MTATDTREPDLLDFLTADTMCNPSHVLIREECLRAIQAVMDRDGDVDRRRARDERADWARRDNRAGQVMSQLVKSGKAVPTGRTVLSGDTEQRAGMQIAPVYRLTERVA